MLHTETVFPTTLELLKRIMRDKHFEGFCLVGGTSLALQIGHRLSVDLDIFSDFTFDEMRLSQYLQYEYGLELDFINKETVKGEIEGVKIDCIAHTYKWISKFTEFDGIRLASLEDLCAMKLNAISVSGTRIKDFIDIAYLSNFFSLNQMLGFYRQKYNVNHLVPLKALTFFDEINFEEPIKMIDKKMTWKKIAKRLCDMQKYPDKVFEG